MPFDEFLMNLSSPDHYFKLLEMLSFGSQQLQHLRKRRPTMNAKTAKLIIVTAVVWTAGLARPAFADGQFPLYFGEAC